jgi:5-formyltetrahydrofolate cyclo-ligase
VTETAARAGEPGKALLRQSARAALAALDPEFRQAASARIARRCLAMPALERPTTVFIYASTAVEVDTHALIDALGAGGHRVLVPRLVSRTEMAAVPFPGWARMVRGALGIPSPPPAPAWPEPVEVAIVPGLAFSLDGTRLGHGAGYYDRWLARHQPARTLALAFEVQLRPWLPRARHDVPVGLVLTEDRTIQPGAGRESNIDSR